MASQAEIDILIDLYCRQFATEFFHNMEGNRILHLMNQNSAGGGSSTSPPTGYFPGLIVTEANFTTATNCPIPALNGFNLLVFWNDTQRYLKKTTEWNVLVGGGFSILIPGFDATAGGFTCTFVLTPAAA